MASVKELEINSTVYDVKGKTVVDNNSGELSFWSGSKAQYDAIQNKDSKCLYSINDDTDVSLTILEALYPVGSVYLTYNNVCPLSALINGSVWTLESTGIVTSVNANVPVKGNGMALGWTDGTNNYGTANTQNFYRLNSGTNFYGVNVGNVNSSYGTQPANNIAMGITTDESKSGIVGTVTRSVSTINVFRRTL